MSFWKGLADRLLNPTSRLETVPGLGVTGRPGREELSLSGPAAPRRRIRMRILLSNGPLVLGTVILLGLLAVALFGPAWAPQNPYIAGQHIVPHFDRDTGEFIRPPLDPSPEFPLGTDQWGTDILSLLLVGARNTLVACAFITMLRVLIGVALGAAAGWNEGGTFDRLVMALIGIMTSLPLLISTMIFIYALDIRRGLPVFIVALSLLGWTEIGQYIRSEFLVLRKRPFIEGARAGGLTGTQIAVRHVLPNILPQLLVISFLEMGAVLLLLGELGFVGVFIGGGSRVDLTEPLGPTEIFTLVEVPEWGAMLADGHRWLRSKPFIVFPPAAAFFVSVLGFNALGEGLRRLIENHSFETGFLLRRRMIVLIAGLSAAALFIMNNTGAAPWFARVAQAYDGERVYEHVRELAAMNGRGIGQQGGLEAAKYIESHFEQYGLAPGWKGNSYRFIQETRLVRPTTQPKLAVLNDAGEVMQAFRHQVDFGFVIDGHGGSGQAEGPLVFVGFEPGRSGLRWEDYQGMDLRGAIALLVRGNAPPEFATEALIRGASGVIWVVSDSPENIRSQIQLARTDLDYLQAPQLPVFRVGAGLASRLVGGDAPSLTALYSEDYEPNQTGPGWFTYPLSARIRMELELGQVARVEVPAIIGYLPGSDLDLANELVVLFAHYAGLGLEPDGTVLPAVNESATGIGVLLELARLWQEQGLEARRTTMFVAWAGTGLDDSGARDYLENAFNFRHIRSGGLGANVSPAYLLQLNGVGAGGDSLQVRWRKGDDPLAGLIERASTQAGVTLSMDRNSGMIDRPVVSPRIDAWATFGWVSGTLSPEVDTLAVIDRGKLRQFGELFALMMTTLVRETRF